MCVCVYIYIYIYIIHIHIYKQQINRTWKIPLAIPLSQPLSWAANFEKGSRATRGLKSGAAIFRIRMLEGGVSLRLPNLKYRITI